MQSVESKEVTAATFNQYGDLEVRFGRDSTLQVFNHSAGYEGWQLYGPGNRYIVAQGGEAWSIRKGNAPTTREGRASDQRWSSQQVWSTADHRAAPAPAHAEPLHIGSADHAMRLEREDTSERCEAGRLAHVKYSF